MTNKLDETSENPKMRYIIDNVKKWVKNNEKIVIYSSFIEKGVKILQDELNKLKIKNDKIIGEVSKIRRQEIVNTYNNNKINVLLISKAGGEGLDLKGTRRIIIFEPAFNKNVIEQAKARGIRYKSHEGLKEKKVDVYYLYLDKPKKLYDDDMMESIDLLLKKHGDKKQLKLNKFMKDLESVN